MPLTLSEITEGKDNTRMIRSSAERAALARRAPSRLEGLEEKMRNKFLQGCSSAREARRHARWAAVVVRAVGGYWAFESAHDAARWLAQNKPMPQQEGRLAL
jgi:hypothetical protein